MVLAMWINAACTRSDRKAIPGVDANPTPGVVRPFLQGTRILELGSGTGLVGLAAAAAGGACVLTDLPDVLQACTRDNVQARPPARVA